MDKLIFIEVVSRLRVSQIEFPVIINLSQIATLNPLKSKKDYFHICMSNDDSLFINQIDFERILRKIPELIGLPDA